MHLAETSIRRPVATAMFFLAVVLLGSISFARLPVDLFPDMEFPRLVIWTFYPEVSPEEMERLVSIPIEQSVMTVSGIRNVRSTSREGLSLVTLEFRWDTNMEFTMLDVREKLDNVSGAGAWPTSAGRPTILRADPNAEPIMSLAVSGAGGIQSVKSLAENVVKRRLEQLDGVALASVTGGREREIHVDVARKKADALGITLAEVEAALRSSNQTSAGALVSQGRFRWHLRPVGELQSVDEIEEVVVVRRGERLVRVRDLATVTDTWREPTSVARFDGEESIGLLIQKEGGSNTSQVSARVREALGTLRSDYPDLDVAVAFDQAEFIDDSIANVFWAVVLGAALAFLVLFFFLHDLRNPINIALAIPISILSTFALLYLAGVSLNMMSLGGLALGVGLLVDNSIVVLENIFRHREEGQDRFRAAGRGAREVAMAVTASTLTTISVFLPIVFVEGVAGQLFRDQALTVTFSLLASLLVSLTLLPMLASRLLHLEGFVEEREAALAVRADRPGARPASAVRWPARLVGGPVLGRGKDAGTWMVQAAVRSAQRASDLFHGATGPVFSAFDRALGRVARTYHDALEWSLDHRRFVLATSGGLVAMAAWTARGLESRLMPQVDQREFRVEILMPPGTALESTVSAAQRLEELLLKIPETEHVFAHAGIVRSQSALGRQDTGLNTADLTVRLKTDGGRSTEAVLAELRERGREIPGATLAFRTGENTFTQVLGAATADLAVKIRGQDLDAMSRLAMELEGELGNTPGLRDIHSDFAAGEPEIRLSLDRRAAETYGLAVGEVVGAVSSAIRGEVATEFQAAEENVDVLVREDAPSRATLEAILALGIPVGLDGPGGGRVPLSQLVGWRYTTGPNEVRRESQNRQITVFASVQGRRVDRAIAEVEDKMALREVPPGTEIVVGGLNQEMRRSFRSLLFALGLSVLLVYMILAAQFESLVHPFSIMFAVPLAVVGVVPGLWIFGEGLNVMSLLGMVVLTGIVVNDAIIKVDLVNHLRRRGRNLRSALVEAGHYRLRPILMTTVTTVLGLLPMAIKIGSGAELRSPLAVAVIGGLLSATVLTLIVIPVVYSVIEGLLGEALQDRGESFPFPVARQGTESGA